MNTPDTEKCCEKCTDGSISGIWCNDESCSCHTPDTEWQEIANQIGLATYGGVSFQANPEYVEKIRNIISSRDTYWKERVDFEAIKWGYMKLLGFGLQNTTAENALMMDRLRDFYQE